MELTNWNVRGQNMDFSSIGFSLDPIDHMINLSCEKKLSLIVSIVGDPCYLTF